MAQRKRRFYSAEDPERGVTLGQLRMCGQNKQIGYLIWWFDAHFYGPPFDLPQRVNGQYDWRYSKDQPTLASYGLGFFRDIVVESVIEEAAAAIEARGNRVWLPKWHEDIGFTTPPHVDEIIHLEGDLNDIARQIASGAAAKYGDPWERRQRERILAEAASIERKARRMPQRRKPRVHDGNRVSEDIDEGQPQVLEIRNVVAALGTELRADEPNAATVAECAQRLTSVLKWLSKKADTFAEKFAEEAGKTTARLAIASGVWISIHPSLHQLIHLATEWLQWVFAASH